MLMDFSKESYDIIIQAGQSNSEGTGFGSVESPYEPNELVWYMNNDFTISRAAEIVEGDGVRSTFVLAFAREYVKKGLLQEGRKLLILRCAAGGTGFLDGHWRKNDDLYLRMVDMIETALSLNKENRLVGFLWHQGETDALLHASYEVHYHHLMELLRSVCEKFQVQDIPFVAGDFVPHWKMDNIEICIPVLKAIRDVCQDYENGAFVETDGLKSNVQGDPNNQRGYDTIHFSRKSCYQLGMRYFEAYCNLLSSKCNM